MLIANFKIRDLIDQLVEKINNDLRILADGLSYIGVETVNKARRCKPICGSFKDRTGNLRSSMGFRLIDINGNEILDFKGTSEGINKGKEVSKLTQNKGITLVIVAGMEYAEFVEGFGYKVISDFLPKEKEIEKFLKNLIK